MLDWFALVVLLVLSITIVSGVFLAGYIPGWIAKQRAHPQYEAVRVCGWMGIMTGGLLLPIAYVWAYWRYPQTKVEEGDKG